MSPETPTIETLLSHAGFVRALARRLLRDVDLAEDVVQDTLIVALESPPRRLDQLRAWLAAVARNLVRRQQRTSVRRVRRETRAARADLSPAAASVAARLEIERRLVRAVSDLDEPGRSAVVLRYFDGLGPTAIAERLGVPVRTVESRLRRALETLRDRLDAGSGGDRRAWALALLPAATPAVLPAVLPIAAAKTAAVTVSGALIMSTPTKIGLGVVVLLLAAFAVRQLAAPPPEAAPEIRREAADSEPPEPPASGTVDAEPPAAGGPAEIAPDLPVDTAACHGRIVFEDGKAVAGEIVRIFGADGPWSRTDEDGIFRLEGIRVDRVPPTVVLGPAESYLSLGALGLAPGEDREVEFVVARGVDALIRVRAPDGTAAAGVEVSLVVRDVEGARSAGGRTTAAGTLRVRRLVPARYRVLIDDPRFRCWRGVLELTGGAVTGPYVIDLLGAAELVVRFEGWPAATTGRITLLLRPFGERAPDGGPLLRKGIVGEDGRFVTEAPPPGVWFTYIKLSGYVYGHGTVRVPENDDRTEKVLPAPTGSLVRGRVVDGRGRPVTAGRVTLYLLEPLGPMRVGEIAADGTVAVPFVLPGRHRVSLDLGAQSFAVLGEPVEVGAAGRDDLVVRLPEGGGIDGRLVGYSRTLIGSALRSVTLRRREPDGWQDWSEVTPDDHGAFRARHLPPGRWQLQTEGSLFGGEAPGEPVEVEVKPDEVTEGVVLGRPAAPRVELLLQAPDGTPFSGSVMAFAEPMGEGSSRALMLEPNDRGRVVLEAFPAGRWRLTFIHLPDPPTVREVEVLDRPGETIVLRLW